LVLSVFPVWEGIAAGSAKAGNQVADNRAAPKQRVDQPGQSLAVRLTSGIPLASRQSSV
jgi:hypothetical protein